MKWLLTCFVWEMGKLRRRGGGKKGRKGKKEKGDGVDVALNENPPFVWVEGPERQQ